MTLTVERVVHLLAGALRADLLPSEDGLFLEVPVRGGREGAILARVDEEELSGVLKSLVAKQRPDDTVLHDGHTYEVLVREESSFPRGIASRWLPIELADPDLRIEYRLGPPSGEYLMMLLDTFGTAEESRYLWRPYLMPRGRLSQLDLLTDQDNDDDRPSALDVLRSASTVSVTMHITSEKEKTLAQLQNYADAFLFHLSYNLDSSFVVLRSLQDLIRRGRIRRRHRGDPGELDPPRRGYDANLIYHYQMGVATDSPALEWLSYYHVAETFFEEVFQDELVLSVRDRLTKPDFSFRRKKDVQSLIHFINGRVRVRQDEMTFSEEEALRLTLLRFVRLDDLVAGLMAIDPALIGHYRAGSVTFANASLIDLQQEDSEKIYTALAKRIYNIRNAVVHSKEGSKPKYVPFRHDGELINEVPLIRLAAEQIILNSARDLS